MSKHANFRGKLLITYRGNFEFINHNLKFTFYLAKTLHIFLSRSIKCFIPQKAVFYETSKLDNFIKKNLITRKSMKKSIGVEWYLVWDKRILVRKNYRYKPQSFYKVYSYLIAYLDTPTRMFATNV